MVEELPTTEGGEMKNGITSANENRAIDIYKLLKQKPRKLSELIKKLKVGKSATMAALVQVRADGHVVNCEGSGERGNPVYWLSEKQGES